MTMGEDKIRAILRRHKLNTLKMVSESTCIKGVVGSPGKALAHGRAKCYLDKGANGCNGKTSESETSKSEVRIPDRSQISKEDR